MNDVSHVDHLSSVKSVTNVPIVAPDLPVGARLHQFGEKLKALGASPKVVIVLKKGYTLAFHFLLNLTRSPTIIIKSVMSILEDPLAVGGITSAYEQDCNRIGQKSELAEVFQLNIFGPKTKQQVETHLRPLSSTDPAIRLLGV